MKLEFTLFPYEYLTREHVFISHNGWVKILIPKGVGLDDTRPVRVTVEQEEEQK